MWRLTGRKFPADSALHRVGHTIVATWSLIVVTAFALGAFRLLRGETMLAGVCVLALIVETLERRRSISGAFTAASRRSVECASVRWEEPSSTSTNGLLIAIWLGWLAFWLGNVVRCGLLEFPNDWDSLAYHIPLIDHWLQQQSLGPSGCAIWHFPGNSELLGLWMVAPFSGDFLVGLANLPVTCLLALSTIDLARQFRLSPPMSHLTGLVVVSNYVVLRQSVDNENDIAVAALFISSLAYALRYARDGNSASALWFGASLGLLLGIKYYATAYGLIAWGTGLFVTFAARGAKSAGRLAGSGAAGAVVLAAYWYARNMSETGTPFFPFGFTRETNVLSDMRASSLLSSTLLGNGHSEITAWMVATVLASLGPLCLIMATALPTTAAKAPVRRGYRHLGAGGPRAGCGGLWSRARRHTIWRRNDSRNTEHGEGSVSSRKIWALLFHDGDAHWYGRAR
jgi:hypothetical protein